MLLEDVISEGPPQNEEEDGNIVEPSLKVLDKVIQPTKDDVQYKDEVMTVERSTREDLSMREQLPPAEDLRSKLLAEAKAEKSRLLAQIQKLISEDSDNIDSPRSEPPQIVTFEGNITTEHTVYAEIPKILAGEEENMMRSETRNHPNESETETSDVDLSCTDTHDCIESDKIVLTTNNAEQEKKTETVEGVQKEAKVVDENNESTGDESETNLEEEAYTDNTNQEVINIERDNSIEVTEKNGVTDFVISKDGPGTPDHASHEREIAETEAHVVQEVEGAITSEIKQFMKCFRGEKTVDEIEEERWETLRIEGKLVLTRHLLIGWKLTNGNCMGMRCDSSPITEKHGVKECVICGGCGSGNDGLYLAILETKMEACAEIEQRCSQDIAESFGRLNESGADNLIYIGGMNHTMSRCDTMNSESEIREESSGEIVANKNNILSGILEAADATLTKALVGWKSVVTCGDDWNVEDDSHLALMDGSMERKGDENKIEGGEEHIPKLLEGDADENKRYDEKEELDSCTQTGLSTVGDEVNVDLNTEINDVLVRVTDTVEGDEGNVGFNTEINDVLLRVRERVEVSGNIFNSSTADENIVREVNRTTENQEEEEIENQAKKDNGDTQVDKEHVAFLQLSSVSSKCENSSPPDDNGDTQVDKGDVPFLQLSSVSSKGENSSLPDDNSREKKVQGAENAAQNLSTHIKQEIENDSADVSGAAIKDINKDTFREEPAENETEAIDYNLNKMEIEVSKKEEEPSNDTVTEEKKTENEVKEKEAMKNDVGGNGAIFQGPTNVAWDQLDFDEMRNIVTEEIGKSVVDGWVILEGSCSACEMPLLGRAIGEVKCVLCGPIYLEEDDGTIESDAGIEREDAGMLEPTVEIEPAEKKVIEFEPEAQTEVEMNEPEAAENETNEPQASIKAAVENETIESEAPIEAVENETIESEAPIEAVENESIESKAPIKPFDIKPKCEFQNEEIKALDLPIGVEMDEDILHDLVAIARAAEDYNHPEILEKNDRHLKKFEFSGDIQKRLEIELPVGVDEDALSDIVAIARAAEDYTNPETSREAKSTLDILKISDDMPREGPDRTEIVATNALHEIMNRMEKTKSRLSASLENSPEIEVETLLEKLASAALAMKTLSEMEHVYQGL